MAILPVFVFFTVVSFEQNVGIGISSPAAGLHLINNNSIIAKGVFGTGAILDETGEGSLFMWNSRKAFFRAGYLSPASATFWNDATTGNYPVGLGYNVKAQGTGAVAIGQLVTSIGGNSLALGYGGDALSPNSIAISGVGCYAKAQFSVAIGNYANANAYGSVAIGRNLNAGYSSTFGQNAFAFGIGDSWDYTAGGHYATGNRAFVFGNNCRSVGNRSFAIGNDNVAGYFFEDPLSGRYGFAIGNSSSATGIYSFAIGNNVHTYAHQGSMVLSSRIDGVAVKSPADFHFLAQFPGG